MVRAPQQGELIWLSFTPQRGREQAGRRPALVLSASAYNAKVGLALVCPITSRAKGYPFEVPLPETCEVKGVVLADQLRSLDWRAREAELIARAPAGVLDDVQKLVRTLLGPSKPPTSKTT
jgi:mRNA interferase MazF